MPIVVFDVDCVFCEVRNEVLYLIQMKARL